MHSEHKQITPQHTGGSLVYSHLLCSLLASLREELFFAVLVFLKMYFLIFIYAMLLSSPPLGDTQPAWLVLKTSLSSDFSVPWGLLILF